MKNSRISSFTEKMKREASYFTSVQYLAFTLGHFVQKFAKQIDNFVLNTSTYFQQIISVF